MCGVLGLSPRSLPRYESAARHGQLPPGAAGLGSRGQIGGELLSRTYSWLSATCHLV